MKALQHEKRDIYTKIIMIVLAIILFIVYFINIKNIQTVWELGDEAGYLSNAAYFTGLDWTEVSGKLSFFNYGYSLLLIPVFLISETGVNLIQGAIFVNICIVIFTYFLQIHLVSKIFPNINKYIIIITAFICGFHPYIATSVNKVICEVFLSCFVWVIATCLYYAVTIRKNIWFILLGVTCSFILFIHVRSLAVLLVIPIILLISIWKKMISWKNLIAFGVPVIFSYLVFYQLKELVILEVFTSVEDIGKTVTNTITSSYISERLGWLFSIKGIPLRVITFSCKVTYIIASTAGLFYWGIKSSVIATLSIIKKKTVTAEGMVKLYFGAYFLAMLVLCTLNGTGSSSNYASYGYGRYYEYLIVPVIFMGIIYLYENKCTMIDYISSSILTVICGFGALQLNSYLDSEEVKIDTCRAAAYTTLAGNDMITTYKELIYAQVIISLLLITVYFLMRNIKKRYLILVPMILVLLINAHDCVVKINSVNKAYSSDSTVASMIVEEDYEVYFIQGTLRSTTYISRLQVLVKDKAIHIITSEELCDLEEGSTVVTYLNEEFEELLEENNYECILESKTYRLHQQ